MGSGISKLFTRGYIVNVGSYNGTTHNILFPPAGKAWLILSGFYYHITGTDTSVLFSTNKEVYNPAATLWILYHEFVASATGSGFYNLFNNTVGERNGSYRPIFILPNMAIHLNSDAGGNINLQVLEFDLT